ncbi:pyridoxal-phosphate dependent enzyme [Sandaracinobacteroides saxicola]|uniref:Pyridoxal-phosphate dependent enzyme n=1 Tax=Sandaracinobacteroides saxicola TaxID=2759707 RepID=A0A7G5IJ91_9SPHN|nr:pyridoxal-phosphate dependent enzyme [Sandaracinobacteroides saxicola]QMW23433.1 pyridoxal-phosphate dependent enzyme [Sandaracinobacteroides saxicola]
MWKKEGEERKGRGQATLSDVAVGEPDRTPARLARVDNSFAIVAPRCALHRTPILTCRTLDSLTGATLFFKCENFQKTGSFKARGASNAVARLSPEAAAKGVVTHSSGNHGAALAMAAQAHGIAATIIMPRTAPAVKKAATAAYGATIIECEPTFAAREAACARVIADTGATLVHPFDNDDVIAGQGTAAAELLADIPDLTVITVPLGGGGLLAGTALAAKAHNPAIRVIAAEPEGAADGARGFASGLREPMPNPKSIADGLLGQMSERTFAIMRAHVDAVVTVSEASIIHAMRLIFMHMKIVIEPSCAVPLAAILSNAWEARGQRVGIILTGGNVDLDRLPWIKDPA